MADLHVTEAEIFLLPSPLQDSDRLAQEEARRIQQHQHNNKMTDYSERVLKPRQNSLLQRKTERQHSMAGEAWRLTQGFPVGGAEDQVCPDVAVDESANQGARRRRTLLQTVTPDPARTNATHALKQKKVIVLPDEPPEDAEGVVRIAVRCPSRRTIHRRFLKTWSSTILLDWMMKSGYPPALYALCSSFPRERLRTAEGLSLEEAGILTHTVLHVEEIEPALP
ncbi:UBX domain-containing protein 8 isoform X2 [Pimephales promelas]|uniref:UBX domain-containing protein 8 isoform X2 n=1 Tax=Pimephales promelas TaxID=90988 RepID=UPI0019558508|nr:UBX domain-containing protein 8 isoform X2 [Pimephales promelas]KAG1970923.1 UBX domain-containing protein [Pimephales promelas]